MNDESVEAVKTSIEQFGYNQPIVVDAENVIVVGHTRYKALQQLGYTDIQVLQLDLSPQKAKAYRIADNKAGETSFWDYKKLIPELREIEDIATMQAFFQEDLAKLIADTAGDIMKDVEQAAYEEAEERLAGSQASLSKSREEGKVEFPCPHCGEEIIMNRSDLPG